MTLCRWLVGVRFGRLLVVGLPVPPGSKGGHTAWPCLCDCGSRRLISCHRLTLTSGSGVKSCGCLGQETRAKNGRANAAQSTRDTLLVKLAAIHTLGMPTTADLAAVLGIHRTNMAASLSALMAAGLVVRHGTRYPGTAKAGPRYDLTPTGRAMILEPAPEMSAQSSAEEAA